MSIIAEWDNPSKTILRWTFQGNWNWAEFFEVTHQTERMLNEADHRVDFLIDMWDSYTLPSDAILQFAKIRQASHLSHPNAGKNMVFGANSFARSVGNLFKSAYQTAHERIFFVEDEEEAYALLKVDRDQTPTQKCSL